MCTENKDLCKRSDLPSRDSCLSMAISGVPHCAALLMEVAASGSVVPYLKTNSVQSSVEHELLESLLDGYH